MRGGTALDMADRDAVVAAARKLAARTTVCGVLSWEEALIATAAHMADELGVAGAGSEGISGCREKARSRRALTAAGFVQPQFEFVMQDSQVVTAADRIGYPVVVKPRAGGAGIGVMLAADAQEVREAFHAAEAFSLLGAPEYRGGALIEEYLAGPEISIDGAVVDDRYTPLFVARKMVGLHPYFAELGHVVNAADDLLFDPLRHAMLAENDGRLVVFMGFDPLFVWALVHVAELMAHEGRYVLPDNFLCNEFYDPENQKFSTSMGHVVWARDLVTEVPRDIIRFYLSRTAPEHARTNFSRAALDEVVGTRLAEPWNELSATLARLTAQAGGAGTLLPVSPQARAWAAAMAAQFSLCFELSSLSLNRAADLVTQNLERLRLHAQRATADDLASDVLRVRIGDLFLQLRALISCAAPILIDLAARTAQAGDFELRISADASYLPETTAFSVPLLNLRTASPGDNGLLSSPTSMV